MVRRPNTDSIFQMQTCQRFVGTSIFLLYFVKQINFDFFSQIAVIMVTYLQLGQLPEHYRKYEIESGISPEVLVDISRIREF